MSSGRTEKLDAEFIEHVSDGVIVLDEDLTVSAINARATELFGVTQAAVMGAEAEAVFGERAGIIEHVRGAVSTGEESEFELREPGSRLLGTVHPGGRQVTVVVRQGKTAGPGTAEDSVLEELHEVASDIESTRDEKIQRMLDIVARYLGVRFGFVTEIEDDEQEIIQSVGDHPDLEVGATSPLSETYCQYTLQDGGTLAVDDAVAEGWEQRSAYRAFELDCYLGVVLSVDDEEYGTVCFADSESRTAGFDEREQTVVELLADWLTLMLERRRYEHELETQKAFTESLLDSLPDPVYAFDSDGTLLRWNDSLETATGYGSSEITSKNPTDFVADEDTDGITDAFESALSGSRVSVEATVVTKDEERVPFEFSGAPLYDEVGEITGVTGVGRDITEQNTFREQLSRILDTTRSLMQARDRQHVGELAANAANELLDEDFSVFRLYDSDAGTLEPIAATGGIESIMDERPVYEIGEGYPGDVFASGEPVIVSDFDDVDMDFGYGNARSAMYYPVGVHGTLSVVSPEPDAFDETDQNVLALLATSAAAACMRAKRMQEIREAREQTERILDRVNGLVQNTIEVLVEARTRDELEAGVVRELAETTPYTFAWIGKPDVATEQLAPTASDGEAALPIEGRSFDLSGQNEPIATAYREGTTQVITDLDTVYGPLASVVDGSDVEAVVVIPLVYKDATYGVLSVCADDTDIFDERERVVLDALGRAVANAINAVERGRILDATEIIELEFAVDSPDLLFNRLSSATDSRVEAVDTDYRSDGSVRLYLSVENVDPEAFVDRVREDSEVLECTSIVEHESECLVELVVEESLLAVLAEYGAATQTVVAENGNTRFTVELPYEAEARELFELVEQRHPGTDLLGYHERERAVETRQDFRAALSDRLTDRQETALRTAYLGGFFDWPRNIDGNELAEAMDIARPTYHQHLRAAQGKVFEELFE